MTFEHPLWLWGLLLILPLALLEWRAVRRAEQAVRAMLGSRPLPGLMAQRLPKRRLSSSALRVGALVFATLGAAGPQWGREAVRRASQGSDLVMVVDVSASMQTRDVPPSRLEEARREAIALLSRLQGSRVGVVAFAGDAIRLCPLTLDPAAVRLTLETLEPGTVSEPGSDLGKALRTALKLLPAGRRDEQAMVIWTDGEDLEGHAREAIAEVKRAGLRVFVVGVGTPAGDVIPMSDMSGVALEVKKDENGNIVRSKLDEPLLRELARGTNGQYFAASRSGGDLVRLTGSLGSLARSKKGTRLVERPVARFPLCALVAALGLVAFLAAPRRRLSERSASLLAPRRAALVLLALLPFVPGQANAQSAWARGDAAWRKKDYARAESLYVQRARLGKPPAELLANLASVRAEQAAGDTVAEKALSRLASRQDQAGQLSGYNLGTLLGRRNEINRSLAELRRALERDPNDLDARWNYELMRKRLQDEQKKQQQQSQQPKDPEPGKDPQPQPQSGQGGQGPQPPPQQGNAQPQPEANAPPAPGMQQPMTKQQAERLLGSLGDLERLERKNQRANKAQKEKRGKDW
ncbi:MAG: VWA domain-containing protein [Candidatus Eisenbacteria bacterium]|nr:VWA domain-containing protein [Candidatus Eisenbacteria bacterium]